MALNLIHLAAFHAVAETGSVTAGAERLMVSQPAVSKQVRELERAVQARLFDRTAKGVRATPAGEALAGYARRLFALVEEAEGALRDLSSLRHGTLSVAATHTIGTYLLPQTIVHFRRRFPGVTLRLDIETAEGLNRRLAEGTVDVALAGSADGFPASAESTVFAEDEVIAIASPRGPWKRRRELSIEALSAQTLVLDAPGSMPRTLFERALRAAGVTLPASGIFTLAGVEAVKRAAESGLGVGVVTAIAVREELRARRLIQVPVSGLPIKRPMHYVRHRARRESKAATAFLCILKHAIRGTLPNLR
jgi:DNA-binding transcriptional LysR family regulator